ncbi:allantoate amidohydrolase [Sporosarcina sp. CAU 1771]
MRINLERMKHKFEEMSAVGATQDGGVTRLALSSSDKEARDLLKEWLSEAGLSVRVDDLGNVYGRQEGTDSTAKPIVIGSHLDSVINSGKFDGTIGLIGALEVIETLREHSIETKRSIEIVNITNEEGFRFAPMKGGSGVLSGDYSIEAVHAAQDENGKTFREELEKIGYLGEKKNRLVDAEAFIELHIEQGPILEQENLPLAVVEKIVGIERFEVTITGEENNAGSTPMSKRKDALSTAARMIVEVEQAAKAIGKNGITTVGDVNVEPGIVNMIPGKVTFLIDARDENLDRAKLEDQLFKGLYEIAKVDGVQMEVKELLSIKPTTFSPKLSEDIVQTADSLGYPIKRMIGGLGHVAMYMNNLCPAAMIFVPSIDGKSHVPDEETNWDDIEKGADVLLNLVHKLAEEEALSLLQEK